MCLCEGVITCFGEGCGDDVGVALMGSLSFTGASSALAITFSCFTLSGLKCGLGRTSATGLEPDPSMVLEWRWGDTRATRGEAVESSSGFWAWVGGSMGPMSRVG